MMLLVQLALTALLAGVDPGDDAVILRSGERLSCVVIEERPEEGVTIRLPSGEVRRLSPAEVQRIEYRDGTVSDVTAPLPVPAPAAPPPVPATPPSPGPAPTSLPLPPSTFMWGITLGAVFPVGGAVDGLAMSSVAKPQVLFGMEGGLRLTPEWMAGLFADVGLGNTGSSFRSACKADGYTCDTVTLRLGAQLRYAFTPQAPDTCWVAVGTGWESTEVSDSEFSNNPALVTFSGWEYLRLSAGIDLRGNGKVGWGAYGLVGLGRYDTVEDLSGTRHLSAAPTHVWIQVGMRSVFGP